MKRRTIVQSALCLLIACGRPHAQEASLQRLPDVHRVYVTPFAPGLGTDVIASHLVAELKKTGRFEVVPSAEQADAFLSGTIQVSKVEHFAKAVADHVYGKATYQARAHVQLLGKNQQILWAEDASGDAPGPGGSNLARVSTSLAERIVKDLLKATAKEAKGH